MSNFNNQKIKVPSMLVRIYSVWFRHFKVYTRFIVSNGLPPFLDPLIFLMGIGLGLGQFVNQIDGVPYIIFLASAIIIPPAMFTSAYECSFGTFIRLEFDKVYDGMLGASITTKDLLIGEILFGGTKGLFFSFCVLLVISLFGLVTYPMAIFAPLIGFLTGLMFASLSLFVTSFVKTINHFSFYFTAFLTPMYFFSGVIFPLKNLPVNIRWISDIMPLTHPVNLARAFCTNKFSFTLFFDLIYIIIFALFAITRLKKRLVD